MSRFASAARSLRGPFRTLIDKMAITTHRMFVRFSGSPRHLSTRETRLLAQAVDARDAELLRLKSLRSIDRPATVVGAYNVRTGEVAVGHSSPTRLQCAEADAVNKLGDVGDVRFTMAKRPTSGGPPFADVKVCAQYCEPAYGRAAFPEPGTLFKSDE